MNHLSNIQQACLALGCLILGAGIYWAIKQRKPGKAPQDDLPASIPDGALSHDVVMAFQNICDDFEKKALAYHIGVLAQVRLKRPMRDKLLVDYDTVLGTPVLVLRDNPILKAAGFAVEQQLLASYLKNIGETELNSNLCLRVDEAIRAKAMLEAERVIKNAEAAI